MTAAITTGIREEQVTTTRVTMELRMSNKECREWASEVEETAKAITATHHRATVVAAAPYPNQTNITSSRRKLLPKR